MIPVKGKTYIIDYSFPTEDEECKELFYKGEATYTGKHTIDVNSETIYEFEMPNNVLTAYFSEFDIVKEI